MRGSGGFVAVVLMVSLVGCSSGGSFQVEFSYPQGPRNGSIHRKRSGCR